jgi:DNA-binding NarL/FixJ family response regulator
LAVTIVCPASSDVEAMIAELHLAGKSIAAIVKVVGASARIVRRVLKLLAMPPRPRSPASGTRQPTILAMHAVGKTIKEISDSLGLDFATVYHVLRRSGRVKKKDRKETR